MRCLGPRSFLVLQTAAVYLMLGNYIWFFASYAWQFHGCFSDCPAAAANATDVASFEDELGFGCAAWQGYDCANSAAWTSGAVIGAYSPAGLAAVGTNCAATCGCNADSFAGRLERVCGSEELLDCETAECEGYRANRLQWQHSGRTFYFMVVDWVVVGILACTLAARLVCLRCTEFVMVRPLPVCLSACLSVCLSGRNKTFAKPPGRHQLLLCLAF
eukprot:SAG22_NODE_1526_length_4224_cov_3.171394_1_plen_217_part_00